jgi:hypothetical protein
MQARHEDERVSTAIGVVTPDELTPACPLVFVLTHSCTSPGRDNSPDVIKANPSITAMTSRDHEAALLAGRNRQWSIARHGVRYTPVTSVRKNRLAANPLSKLNLPEGWSAPHAPEDVVDLRSVGGAELIADILTVASYVGRRQGSGSSPSTDACSTP